MKRTLALIFAGLLVFAACGDSGGGSDDPADATSCDDLVDSGLVLLQDALDALSELSLEDIATLEDDPEALQDLETRGEALQTRATELGCDESELSASLSERVDELEANGPFAELILEGIKDDPGFFE